jgi:hypothetical protein
MYKMEMNVSDQQRVFLFRGPGCRKAMLEWWRDHLRRAETGADIRMQGWRVRARRPCEIFLSIGARRLSGGTAAG